MNNELVKEIKSKKEYEISKNLFELLNDSVLFRVLFFGGVAKRLDSGFYSGFPTNIGENDLLSKAEVEYDMDPKDEYYLNMKNVEASILAIGDLDHLYDDTKGMVYGDRILPATLKLGNYLFIVDYENYDYYADLYDHRNDLDIINKMEEELPFYRSSDKCGYNSFIHKVKIPHILETIKAYSYYKLTKEEAKKMLEFLNMILEKFPEYNNDENKDLQGIYEFTINPVFDV